MTIYVPSFLRGWILCSINMDWIDAWFRANPDKELDWSVAIRILLQAWESITTEEVLSAWDHLISYQDNE